MFSKTFSLFSKALNAQFPLIETWFTNHNYQSLEVEDRINLTLVIIYISVKLEDSFYVKLFAKKNIKKWVKLWIRVKVVNITKNL